MNEPTKDNALSRIYREGAWPEPSRQIDQAILAASRRAAREHSFVRRWAPSFAVAATVVLTSTLVLKVYREQPEAVSPSVSDKQSETRARPGLVAPEPKVAEAKSTADSRVSEAKAAAAPPPVPKTPRGFTSSMDAGEAERLDRLQHDLGVKQSLPANESPLPPPKSALAEKSAPTLKKEVSDAPRASPTPRRPELPQGPATSQLREQPANAPVSIFGAPAQQPLREAAKPAAPASPISGEAYAPSPSPAAGADSAPSNAPSAALAARVAPKASERTPQTWLEDIRKLIAEGKLEQADRELTDFKKRYPDYVLPGDMR